LAVCLRSRCPVIDEQVLAHLADFGSQLVTGAREIHDGHQMAIAIDGPPCLRLAVDPVRQRRGGQREVRFIFEAHGTLLLRGVQPETLEWNSPNYCTAHAALPALRP